MIQQKYLINNSELCHRIAEFLTSLGTCTFATSPEDRDKLMFLAALELVNNPQTTPQTT